MQPPLVICACRYPMDPAGKRKDYTDVDIGIVVDHLILAAAELGLGTCWIGAFDPVATREVLGLPDEVEPAVEANGYTCRRANSNAAVNAMTGAGVLAGRKGNA